jgi:predicted DNA-binding antitoxin AbrB/MazE fold protein
MAIHINAIYQDGVLRPGVPLDLPNNTRVVITVAPVAKAPQCDEDESLLRHGPKQITVDEFHRILESLTISAPPLSPDWDRHDIYSDHD